MHVCSTTFFTALLLSLMLSVSAASQTTVSGEGHIDGMAQRLFVRWFSTGERLGPITLVAVLHGDAPRTNPDYQYRFAQKLASSNKDIVAAAILRPGYTDPKGNRSEGKRGQSTGDNWNAANTDSIANVIRHLRAKFAAKRMVLIGHSGGAAIAANILGRHPKLADAAVLVSCPCNVNMWRKHMFDRTEFLGFKEDLDTISPEDYIARIRDDVEVVVIVGDADDITPTKLTDEYIRLASKYDKQVSRIVLPDKGHEILHSAEVFDVAAKLIGGKSALEPNEPPHVHVDRDDLSAKFWLDPVGLARNLGFPPKELRRIQKLVVEHQAEFLESWHGHFGTDG